MLLGHSYGGMGHPNVKKDPFLEKLAPKSSHRNFCPIDDFWGMTPNEHFQFLKWGAIIFIREMNEDAQNFTNSLLN